MLAGLQTLYIKATKRNISNGPIFSAISSSTVFGTRMLLFTFPHATPNLASSWSNVSSDAIDSGVFALEMTEDKSRGTLIEVHNWIETPLVSYNDGRVQMPTKIPFVWRRRPDFGGKTFRAISR